MLLQAKKKYPKVGCKFEENKIIFGEVLVSVLLSAHVKRFSVTQM